MIKTVTVEPCAIAEFMKSWPCSGLHNVHHLIAAFDERNGDLIDIEAYQDDEETRRVNPDDYDQSGAMPALLDDAFKHSRNTAPPEMLPHNVYDYKQTQTHTLGA